MLVLIGIPSVWLTVYSGFNLSGFPYCFCKHFPPNCITCVTRIYSRNENRIGMRMSLKYLSERWTVTSLQMDKGLDVYKKSWADKKKLPQEADAIFSWVGFWFLGSKGGCFEVKCNQEHIPPSIFKYWTTALRFFLLCDQPFLVQQCSMKLTGSMVISCSVLASATEFPQSQTCHQPQWKLEGFACKHIF